jgi:DNA-binding beta-propeller fold protein YncE
MESLDGKVARKALLLLVVGLILVGLTIGAAEAQTAADYHLKAVLTAEVMGRFQQPEGLFFNPSSGQLLVGDVGKRRLVFFRETDGVLTASKEIELKAEVGVPTNFVQTSEGRIILADKNQGRVLVLYPSGALAAPFDLSQVPEGGSILPGALVLDRSDKLYMVDETNKRILVFDSKGKFQRAVRPDDPAIRGINAVAVDASSNIYALDTLGGKIYQFSPEGQLLKKFGQRGPGVDQFDFPTDLAVDRQGFVYVIDQHRGTIVVFNNRQRYQANIGSMGWDKGKLLFPTAIVIDDKDQIYIVDRENRRVQVFVRKEG